MSAGRRHLLMQWAKKNEILVIEHDFDRIADPPAVEYPPLKAIDTRGLVVYAGSFGRAVLPGVHVSFAIAPPALVDAFIGTKPVWGGPPSVPEQAALARFINEGAFARHLVHMRAAFAGRREALVRELRRNFAGSIVSIERCAGMQLVVRIESDLPDTDIASAATKAGLGVTACSRWTGEPALLIEYGTVSEDDAGNFVRSLNAAVDAIRSHQLC
jgi:GntR family transcriptional regulator/MocR family aminotransferase